MFYKTYVKNIIKKINEKYLDIRIINIKRKFNEIKNIKIKIKK